MNKLERKIVEFINSLPVEDIFVPNKQILGKLVRNSNNIPVSRDGYFEVKEIPISVSDCPYIFQDKELGFEYSLQKYSDSFYFGAKTRIS